MRLSGLSTADQIGELTAGCPPRTYLSARGRQQIINDVSKTSHIIARTLDCLLACAQLSEQFSTLLGCCSPQAAVMANRELCSGCVDASRRGEAACVECGSTPPRQQPRSARSRGWLRGLASAAGAAKRAIGAALNSHVGLVAVNGFFLVSGLMLGSSVLGNHIRGAADVHGNHVRGAVKQGTGVLGAVYAGVAGLGGAVVARFKVRSSRAASCRQP